MRYFEPFSWSALPFEPESDAQMTAIGRAAIHYAELDRQTALLLESLGCPSIIAMDVEALLPSAG